eukprot:SAG11_NODE_2980_length_2794_cov_7.536549_2_plen_680_part_00
MARFGFVPQFSSPPVQLAPPLEPQWSTEVLPRIQEIHAALLQSSTVEEVAPPDYDAAQVHLAAAAAMCYYGGTPFLVPSVVMPFVHIMFAVPKPHSDKWRGVSGLRRFNSWIIPQHFKMEGLHTVRQLIRPRDYLTVIDLRAAYPTMGIHPRYRDYFIYRFRQKWYRYKGAVFGVSSLPRAFTKLLRAPVAFLRSFGIRVIVYLDDLLILAESYVQCAQDTQDVITLLTYLGFVISSKEQVKLIPAQRQVWCGAEICSLTMMFFLPKQKTKDMKRLFRSTAKAVRAGKRLILRKWAQVLGVMRATMFAVLPALLWSQGIRRFVNSGISADKACWNQLMPMPPNEVLENLDVWVSKRFDEFNGRSIRPLPVDIQTDSDASGTIGGGMVMRSPQQLEARWHWLPHEMKHHINWKELQTHLQGLQALDLEAPGLLLNAVIRNRTDNSVSMSYVNRQGGRVPLLSLAAEALWKWLLDRGLVIRDDFVAGVQNQLADDASRWFLDLSEWMLKPTLFQRLHRSTRWGPFSVDAFASRVNRQLPRFWSRHADPDAEGCADALRHQWSAHNLWICPPNPMIPRILQKLQVERCQRATLLAPLWPSQPWWPLVLQLCGQALVLGRFDRTFLHPVQREAFPTRPTHLRVPTWKVAVFRLSGVRSNSRDSVLQLSKDLLRHGKASLLNRR